MNYQATGGRRVFANGYFNECKDFFPREYIEPSVRVDVAESYWESRIAQPWQKVEWPERSDKPLPKSSREEVAKYAQSILAFLTDDFLSLYPRTITRMAFESGVIPERMVENPKILSTVREWKKSRQPKRQAEVVTVIEEPEQPDPIDNVESGPSGSFSEFIALRWFSLFVHFNWTEIRGCKFYCYYPKSKFVDGKVMVPLFSYDTRDVYLFVYPFAEHDKSWSRLEGPPELFSPIKIQ